MKKSLTLFLMFFLFSLIFVNCSLLSLDEEKVSVDEINKDSISGDVEFDQEDGEDFFDVEGDEFFEEDMADESKEKTDGVVSEEDDSSEGSGDELEEGLAEGDESEWGPDNGLTDDDSENIGEAETSDENQVDQQLVRDELEEPLSDEEEIEEFTLESELQESKFGLEETEAIAGPPPDDSSESAETSGNSFEDASQDNQTSFSNEVVNLEYKSFEKGGTVVIETTSPANYEIIKDLDKNQWIIQIAEVHLPEKFKRPYITKDFKQDIAAINAYTDQETGAARFVIQTKRPIEPVVQKEGSSILVMSNNDGSSEGNDAVDIMDKEGSSQQESGGDDSEAGTTSMSQDNQALKEAFGQSDQSDISVNVGEFTGERINLEFSDTNIRTIIELISDRYGINLIMDDDVSGNINIRLRQVPWDQALLVILRAKGLGYVKQGNVLRIAKQATLSKEAKELSEQIKSEKEARLLSGGLKVKYIPVSYAKVSELSGKLKDFISKEGKIASDERTSSLVITDYDEYIGRVMELVKALDTPPMQVEISAKLIEARDEFIKDVGINWDLGGQSFDMGSQAGQLGTRFGGGINTAALSFDLSVGTFDLFGDLGATLGLYESEDKVKVLSQPKVVTMNKIKATIQQTTQIPIRQTVIQPNTPPVVTFNFIDLTVLLDVTPQITFNEDVILDVELKREFPGVASADGRRELNRRSAKTTVMVKNGSTAVIGGIYQMDNTNTNKGIPFLKDIPFIGRLFRQTTEQKTKNELLLFLKPKILKRRLGDSIMSKSGGQTLFEEDSVGLDVPDEFNEFEAEPLTDEPYVNPGATEPSYEEGDLQDDLNF